MEWKRKERGRGRREEGKRKERGRGRREEGKRKEGGGEEGRGEGKEEGNEGERDAGNEHVDFPVFSTCTSESEGNFWSQFQREKPKSPPTLTCGTKNISLYRYRVSRQH